MSVTVSTGNLHAVERNRMLSGLALGYTPQAILISGPDHVRVGNDTSRYGRLLHATALTDAMGRCAMIALLGKALSRGLLPAFWGTDVERTRSEFIAAAVPGARVSDRVPLDQAAKLIAGARFVIGVDTGLP
jgi:heptosyltransferase-1